jgi:hypothetical protein
MAHLPEEERRIVEEATKEQKIAKRVLHKEV